MEQYNTSTNKIQTFFKALKTVVASLDIRQTSTGSSCSYPARRLECLLACLWLTRDLYWDEWGATCLAARGALSRGAGAEPSREELTVPGGAEPSLEELTVPGGERGLITGACLLLLRLSRGRWDARSGSCSFSRVPRAGCLRSASDDVWLTLRLLLVEDTPSSGRFAKWPWLLTLDCGSRTSGRALAASLVPPVESRLSLSLSRISASDRSINNVTPTRSILGLRNVLETTARKRGVDGEFKRKEKRWIVYKPLQKK